MDFLSQDDRITPSNMIGAEQKLFQTISRPPRLPNFLKGTLAILALASVATTLPSAPAEAQANAPALSRTSTPERTWVESTEKSFVPVEQVESRDVEGHKVSILYFAQSVKAELARMRVDFDEKTGALTCHKMNGVIGASGTTPVYGTGGNFNLMGIEGGMHTSTISFEGVVRVHLSMSKLEADTLTIQLPVKIVSTGGTSVQSQRMLIQDGVCAIVE